MTTVDITLTNDDHDAAEKDDGTGFSAAGDIIISSHPAASARYNGGFYGVLNIPQGATISVANMKGKCTDTTWDNANVKIGCEDVDNASHFGATGGVEDVTTRLASMTTATVDFIQDNLGTSEFTTGSLVGPLQEIIDRAGYASGNGIVFLWEAYGDGTKRFRLDQGTVKIYVEYTSGDQTFNAAVGLIEATTPAVAFEQPMAPDAGLVEITTPAVAFEQPMAPDAGLVEITTPAVTFQQTAAQEFTAAIGLIEATTPAVAFEQPMVTAVGLIEATTPAVAFEQPMVTAVGLIEVTTPAVTFLQSENNAALWAADMRRRNI